MGDVIVALFQVYGQAMSLMHKIGSRKEHKMYFSNVEAFKKKLLALCVSILNITAHFGCFTAETKLSTFFTRPLAEFYLAEYDIASFQRVAPFLRRLARRLTPMLGSWTFHAGFMHLPH